MDAFAQLAARGFDLAHTFDAHAAAQLPGLAMLGGAGRLGVLVGNTRALWPVFAAALADPAHALGAEPDPLDRYTERAIEAAFDAPVEAPAEAPVDAPAEAPVDAPAEAPVDAPAEAPVDAPAEAPVDAPAESSAESSVDAPRETSLVASRAAAPRIFYGHRRYGDAFVPLQRLAAATGLGALSPTHLVIHPVYGPWIALRAVVLLGGEPPPRAPIAPPCQCGPACREALARAEATGAPRDWLSVRDACSLRAWRYGEPQLAFHLRGAARQRA